MAQNYPEESTARVYPLDVRFMRVTIGEWFQVEGLHITYYYL